MFTVPRLDTLEDLPKLISDLSKLMVNLLAERLMFLLQSSNLFFQAINALGVNLLGYNSPRRPIVRRPTASGFRFALPLAFPRALYETGVRRISKVLSFTRTENLETLGTVSNESVQAQTPARRNDRVGIQGDLVA